MASTITRDGYVFLRTEGSTETELSVQRTDSDTDNPLAQIKMFGSGKDDFQGVLSFETINSGSSDGPTEERMRIHTNGNVGIGTLEPDAKLHVVDGKDATLKSDSGFLVVGSVGSANIVMDDNEIMARKDGKTSALNLQAEGGALTVHNLQDESKKFVVKDSGNVGIGTADPGDKLTISEGDLKIEGGRYRRLKIVSDSYWAGIELVARENGEAGNPHIDFTHGELGSPNYGIRLYAPTNDKFVIHGGNVGIGTADPKAKLDVDGFTRSLGISVNNAANTGVGRGLWLWSPSDSNHVIYSANPKGKSPANKTAAKGYFDAGHRLRLRTCTGQGFLFENNKETALVDIDSDNGRLWTKGAIYSGNSDLYFTKTDHDHTGTGNAKGYAAIENAKNFDALMILGRAGTSKGRYVRLWDYLQVNGHMDITGNVGIGTTNPPTGRLDVVSPWGDWIFLRQARKTEGGGGFHIHNPWKDTDTAERNSLVIAYQTSKGEHKWNQGFAIHGPTGNVSIGGNLGTHGFSPKPKTNGWGGGIHTWDVEAEGTMWSRHGYQSGKRDLAENYLSDMDLEPGDVVCLDMDKDGIVLTDKPNDILVLGVISTEPGFLLDVEHNIETENVFPVALCGRVPCKVVDENGPIKRGDLLTSSSTLGHAMKAKPSKMGEQEFFSPGTIIGKALGSLESGKGVIDTFVFLM